MTKLNLFVLCIVVLEETLNTNFCSLTKILDFHFSLYKFCDNFSLVECWKKCQKILRNRRKADRNFLYNDTIITVVSAFKTYI